LCDSAVDECTGEQRAQGDVSLEIRSDVHEGGDSEGEEDAGDGDGALGRAEVEHATRRAERSPRKGLREVGEGLQGKRSVLDDGVTA
jgi:hypothetical protein